MTYPQATILQGDCIERLRELEAESAHCVVTSPPYYGLRCYGVDGQIGLEASVEEHIAKLVEVFREVRRVLRKDGTVWLNYGDAYACAPNGNSAASYKGKDDRTFRDKPCGTVGGGLKPKDLMLLPHRVAIALQADGWWVRADCVWSKANPMPESVTDRPTRSHEYVFLLSRSERYFYDADAIREPAQDRAQPLPEMKSIRPNNTEWHDNRYAPGASGYGHNPAGRNKRTVWEIATEPYAEAHFATFPRALVRPCVLAGTSARGCCAACGAPWRRETESQRTNCDFQATKTPRRTYPQSGRCGDVSRSTTGWRPSCRCQCADTRPCVVLDCFAGSGTVGEVAMSLGRSAVLVELNPKYCQMIRKRLSRVQVPLMLEEDGPPVVEETAETTLLDLMAAD